MTAYIKIRQGIQQNGNSSADDVVQVKNSLKDLGYYKEPKYGITQYPDEKMFSGIRKFQKDNNLKADGVIKPNGSTEKVLDKELKVSGKSPVIRCPTCGAPHGGVYGPICTDCLAK